jgi:PAS domain S-box-containing protein
MVFLTVGILTSTAVSFVFLSPTLLIWSLLGPAGLWMAVGQRTGVLAWVVVSASAVALLLTPTGSPLVLWALAAILGSAAFLGITGVVLHLIEVTFELYQAQHTAMLDLLASTQTSQSRYVNQTRFLETLLDLIPFPLFSKSMEGQFLNVNASFEVVFDVPRAQVIGKNNDFLLENNARNLAKIELDVLARDSMAAEETQLVHADGKLHDFIVYMMPFADTEQSTQGYIGVLIDITERKVKEQRLIQLNDTKDQLFSIISHDLRGPVGKIKQLLDIYVEDQGIFDRATWETVFQDMRKSSDSLFQLLENLLSWVRSQRGEDDSVFELFALEPVVTDVFSLQKLMATDKKIQLVHNLKLTGPVLSDKQILSTILRNLVNNALKFTKPGGLVTVGAGETEAELFITVADNGVGMSGEVIGRIFQKHEHLTTWGTGKERGQGIGLGLCLDLTATLGGHLSVESTEGVGTTVTLHLPTTEL